MKRPGAIEFLDRPAYRQRRFRDAARLLPLFGCIMVLLPLMWPRGVPEQGQTSTGMVYLFGIWILLIACAFALSRLLRDVFPHNPVEAGEAEVQTPPSGAPDPQIADVRRHEGRGAEQ